MIDGLYHRNIYWPTDFDSFFETHKVNKIVFSNHVKENQYTEEKRIYNINDVTIDFIKKGTIFEIEIKKGLINKIVVRKHYKNDDDICIALAVEKNNILLCKTCYLNKENDTHYTLDPKKYVKGNETKSSHNLTISISELLKNNKN